jgi:chaperonin cofactor prefoldin
MCEFVADDIDVKTLDKAKKDKLKEDLEKRKEELIKRVLQLEVQIYRISQ